MSRFVEIKFQGVGRTWGLHIGHGTKKLIDSLVGAILKGAYAAVKATMFYTRRLFVNKLRTQSIPMAPLSAEWYDQKVSSGYDPRILFMTGRYIKSWQARHATDFYRSEYGNNVYGAYALHPTGTSTKARVIAGQVFVYEGLMSNQMKGVVLDRDPNVINDQKQTCFNLPERPHLIVAVEMAKIFVDRIVPAMIKKAFRLARPGYGKINYPGVAELLRP